MKNKDDLVQLAQPNKILYQCAWCKQPLHGTRAEDLNMPLAEGYIVSHGICEDCAAKHFGTKSQDKERDDERIKTRT